MSAYPDPARMPVPVWMDLVGILPPVTSVPALMHGLIVDWRWDAPGTAAALGFPIPEHPGPWLSELLMRHAVITSNRSAF